MINYLIMLINKKNLKLKKMSKALLKSNIQFEEIFNRNFMNN